MPCDFWTRRYLKIRKILHVSGVVKWIVKKCERKIIPLLFSPVLFGSGIHFAKRHIKVEVKFLGLMPRMFDVSVV